ncbi:hypothetical protein PRZ48_009847 [Zasmidium cellare]|uniref:Carbohydrate esterase family 16 protein n=1 Tax=Zasmidium cellare TaxID=395010 RepID=A0ABR0ED95_ZASCE|nr:hypothetical protein PRZ48_009847 [Zasmidium cellare]
MVSSTLVWFGLSATVAANFPGWPHGPWGGPQHGGPQHGGQQWGLKKFTSLVAFGDSYTDDSRLGYFGAHNGTAPPVGWVNPVNYAASSGGRIWVEYVKQYTGVNLYNYAVSGAVCSNAITPRTFTTYDFPAVREYEIPAYLADAKYVEPNGAKFVINPPDETVYTIWIGTNDLGVDALLTDSQVKGKTIVDYMDCVYEQLERLYESGARWFVVLNAAPLNLTPLYGLPEKGGVITGGYWPNKPSNTTEISYRMLESVATVNSIYEYRTAFAAQISSAFKDAHFAVFDVHGLMTDIYNNPSAYLNGTAPLNVTGAVHECDASGAACTNSESPDSFMWYDDLHPSEQTDRVIAREFVGVVKGGSKWGRYWG